MTTSQAKSEILTLLEQLPDRHIQAILGYLKQLKAFVAIDEEAAVHLEEIILEDDSFLKCLAE